MITPDDLKTLIIMELAGVDECVGTDDKHAVYAAIAAAYFFGPPSPHGKRARFSDLIKRFSAADGFDDLDDCCHKNPDLLMAYVDYGNAVLRVWEMLAVCSKNEREA